MKILFIAIISFFILNYSFAQKVYFNAILEKNNIVIGDQIYYSIEAKYKNTDKVAINWLKLKDTLSKNIEIVEQKLDTIKSADGNITQKFSYKITSFDSGYYNIPSYNVSFIEDNDTFSYDTPNFYLSVNTIPVDTVSQVIKDIKTPYEAPLTFKEILPWIVGGLLITALIIIIIYIFKNREKVSLSNLIKKQDEPIHVTSLKLLDELKSKKLWQQDKHKEYYIELSDIIRNYIERRYNIEILDKITVEIIASLKQINLDSKLIENIKTILETSDLAKFAKHKPLSNENDICLNLAYTFIDETKQEIINNKK